MGGCWLQTGNLEKNIVSGSLELGILNFTGIRFASFLKPIRSSSSLKLLLSRVKDFYRKKRGVCRFFLA